MIPKSVTLNKSKRNIQLEYSNNKFLLLSSSDLRTYSPSAQNKNLLRDLKITKANQFKSVLIEKIVPVGNYAIRIIFDDGHNTGIFSWNYLYNLGSRSRDSLAP